MLWVGPKILLVTQKNAGDDDPQPDDIYNVGTVGTVLQLLKLPDGTVKVLVEGKKRVKILKFKDEEKFISCTYEQINDNKTQEDLFPLAITAIKRLEKLSSINKKVSQDVIANIKQMKSLFHVISATIMIN